MSGYKNKRLKVFGNRIALRRVLHQGSIVPLNSIKPNQLPNKAYLKPQQIYSLIHTSNQNMADTIFSRFVQQSEEKCTLYPEPHQKLTGSFLG